MSTSGLAIAGMGRAGKARLRALKTMDNVSVVQTYSRRTHPVSVWNEILLDNTIEAVIISTETSAHYSLVKDALLADKHVAVEYPLANRLEQAVELYRLAEQRQKVLHCEFIGLLTDSHKQRRFLCQGPEVQSIRCAFKGGTNPWIATEIQAKRYGQLSIGRLQAIWDSCGAVELVTVTVTKQDDSYTLNVGLKDAQERSIFLEESRAKGQKRATTWQFFDRADTEIFPQSASVSPDLFLSDSKCFLQQVQEGGHGYVAKADVLGVLKLAEQITALGAR